MNLHTVEAAKAWLKEKALKRGGYCPVCNRWTKVYKRKITSSMARFLIDFWVEYQDFEFHHVGRNYRKCGDYGKLAYWDLIESRGDVPDAKKHSGYWRLTNRGYNFIHRQIAIQQTVQVYDSQVLGFIGPYILIDKALADKFDYRELMEL